MYMAMAERMTWEQKQIFIEQYGGMGEWKRAFLEGAATEEAQKNFGKIVDWYGGKEQALEAAMNPKGADTKEECQKRMGEILQELAASKGMEIHSPGILKLVQEYDFLTRQLFQLPDATDMVLEIARAYQENSELQAAQDSIYGERTTEYAGKVLEAFYGKGSF